MLGVDNLFDITSKSTVELIDGGTITSGVLVGGIQLDIVNLGSGGFLFCYRQSFRRYNWHHSNDFFCFFE